MKIFPMEDGSSYKSRFKMAGADATTGEFTGSMDTVDTETVGMNLQDVSQDITKMHPDAYPLDTITRNLSFKKRRVTNQEVKYYQQPSKPSMDTIEATAHGSGASAASPASSYQSDEVGIASIFIQVKTPKLWKEKDTLVMRNLSLNCDATGKLITDGSELTVYDQMFYVASKSGSVLELVPIGGMVGTEEMANTYAVPSFTNTAVLYRLGTAMAEKDMQCGAFGIVPTSTVNYCQNFMCQVEESTFEKMTSKEVKFDMSDLEADALYAMRGDMESSFLWGVKYKLDEGTDRTYFTDGITRQVQKVLQYGTGNGDTSLTKEQYTAWLKSLFTGNSGSNVRILLAGSDLIAAIELLRESEKQISGSSVEDTYLGVKCSSIVSTFGTLKVMREPNFDEMGWGAKGLALDPAYLEKCEFLPMTARSVDFKTSGQKNVDAKVLQEVSCLNLRFPDCHAIIEPRE